MNAPEIEFAPLDDIKKYQERRLQEALEYVASNSPFYKRLFAQNNIDYKKIKTIEDLRQIPFTTKRDLQLYNDDFVCVPRQKIIDYITTSGTLGDPVTFAMTDNDLNRLAYNEKISFTCTGIQPSDIVQLMTTIDKRFMAGLAYFLGLRALGAGVIRVGNGIPELQWDTIRRIKPTAIMCVPSFIPHIIDYAEKNGIDYKNTSVKKIICIGDSLRNQDFTPNLLATQILDKWPIKLYSTYASTEMSTTFAECDYGCGGHHHPELIIVEFVDENGNAVAEGDAGEVVVTTLGVEGMPLVRFKTGDLATFHTEKCKCGRTSFRISSIIGRLNQMVKYKGTTLYPPAIFDVLDNTYFVQNYVVKVLLNSDGTDRVVVCIGLKSRPYDDNQMIIKDLKDRFRARIRVAPEIEILACDEIQKLNFPQMSRKPVKFLDLRK